MTGDLASDLAYLEGQVSVVLRYDGGKKLKCKEGYVQRGSACQKIGEKKAGGDSARNIGAGLGAAALVGGAVAIASKNANKNGLKSATPSPVQTQSSQPLVLDAKNRERLLIGGLSTAVAGGAIAAVSKRGVLSNAKSGASRVAEGKVKETASQVLIRRRVKDLNNPKYIENSTEILNEFASKPKVAEAVSTFLFPGFNTVSKEDAEKKKKQASKVIINEVMTNPKARRAAINYGTGLASEWAKDPEMRRIAGEAVAKTVSGPKDESQLSPFQKILRRSERDSILLGTAISLAIKKRSLKGISKEATSKTNTVVQKINENRDSGDLGDVDTLNFFYAFYASKNEVKADASRKLKCKEGYIQRGNACQKITSKASNPNLSGNIGAGLAVAALTGGAIAAGVSASRQNENKGRSSAQGILEKAQELSSKSSVNTTDRKTKIAAISVGSAAAIAASYMGINALDSKYQIKEKALLSAYAASLDNGEKMDSIIDQSSLKASQKIKAKNLVGATKAYLAKSVLESRGFDLADVDKENNSFTYRNPKDKSVVTVGSAGSAVVTFRSNSAGDAKGFPKFDMAFQVNESFAKSDGIDRKQGLQIIKSTKAAFKKHLELLPDDALLSCEAFKDDGAGKKRQSIYEKEGFTSLPGVNPKYLFAVKNQGKFAAIPESQKKHIAGMLGVRSDSLKGSR